LEQGLYKISDAEVLEKAKVENRVLLTIDLDFGYLHSHP
jgi:predicted nuclease of predicted toxin-antitoxin system